MAIFSWASRLGLIALVFTYAAAAQGSADSQNPGATQAPAAQPASPQPDLLIKNGTVLTVTHGVIQNGSVLVHNGKIAQIGTNIAAPAGATVIDAARKFVMPGVIDCHSHLALATITAGFALISLTAVRAEFLEHFYPAESREISVDITLLADRLAGIIDWLGKNPQTQHLRVGLFGSSTGGGAALVAAAQRPDAVGAVVSTRLRQRTRA